MTIFTVGVELFSSERETMTDRQTEGQTNVTGKNSLLGLLRKGLKSGKFIRMYKKLTA